MAVEVSFTIHLDKDGNGYTDLDFPRTKTVGGPTLNASDPGPGGSGYPAKVDLSYLAIGEKTRVVAVGGPANATIGVVIDRV